MLEFFFDCSSPWTYLAFHNILPLAHAYGEDIEWRPILVGGIFNTINPSVYQSREKPVPAKAHYAQKDLADWARVAGLKIIRPTIFPVNSVKAMRGCILLQRQDKLVAFARAVFQAYWSEDRDISNARSWPTFAPPLVPINRAFLPVFPSRASRINCGRIPTS